VVAHLVRDQKSDNGTQPGIGFGDFLEFEMHHMQRIGFRYFDGAKIDIAGAIHDRPVHAVAQPGPEQARECRIQLLMRAALQ
jgi:hypothetical protein